LMLGASNDGYDDKEFISLDIRMLSHQVRWRENNAPVRCVLIGWKIFVWKVDFPS